MLVMKVVKTKVKKLKQQLKISRNTFAGLKKVNSRNCDLTITLVGKTNTKCNTKQSI